MKKSFIFTGLSAALLLSACGESPEQKAGTDPQTGAPMRAETTTAAQGDMHDEATLMEKTKEVSKETWDKTKEITSDTAENVSEKTKEYYDSAKQNASEIGTSVAEKSGEYYESAKTKTVEVYEATKEKGTEMMSDMMPKDE